MSDSYGVQIGFVQWMLVGVPLVALALPLTWLLLTRVLHPLRTTSAIAGREIIQREIAALGPVSRAEITVGVITLLTAVS